MKKLLETILALTCLFSLVIAGGEEPDGSCDPWWTIGWFGLAIVCGLMWGKYFDNNAVQKKTD